MKSLTFWRTTPHTGSPNRRKSAVRAAGCLLAFILGIGVVQGDTYNYVGLSTTSNNWCVASTWTNGSGAFPNTAGDIVRPLSPANKDVNLYLNTNITIGTLEWSGSAVYLRPGVPIGKLTNDNLGTPATWRIGVSNFFYLDPDLILKDSLTLSISNGAGFDSTRFDAVRIVGLVSGPGKLTLDTPVPVLNTYPIGFEGGGANTYGGGTRLIGHPSGGTIYEPRKYKAFGTGDVEVGPGARLYLRKRGTTDDYIADPAALWLESQTATNRANVYLESGVNETVARLYLDGIQQPSGTYGATGSPAAEMLDEFLAGPGMLTVTSGPPSPGALRNLPAVAVVSLQATLRGEVLATNAAPTLVYLYWGHTDGGRDRAAWSNEIFIGESAVGEFSSIINVGAGHAGETIYYRCYLTNVLGGKWASTTTKICPPVIRNELPVVRTNFVTLRGSLLTTNGLPTSMTVYWGTNDGGTAPANWQNSIALGVTASGLFATNISGLPPNTTCYYRCYGTNDSGAAWAGNSQAFTSVGTPAYGEIVFLVGSDLHMGFTYHVPTCTERTGSTLDNMNLIPGLSFPASLGGGPVALPRGLLAVGDLTENGTLAQWMAFTNDFGLNGERRFSFPVFEAYGNHDNTTVIADGIKARNPLRTGGRNFNISTNGYHYSWDWDFLHVVCLNVFPGNETDPGYLTIDPRSSLQFVISDLATNVGTSGRPVVIFHHYGYDANSGLGSWSNRQRTNFYNVIKNYNVIGIFSGHSHLREYVNWQGIATFVDGTMGKYSGNFLVARVTRTNFSVAERTATNTWNYTFKTNITVPQPLSVSNGNGATEITYSSARMNGAFQADGALSVGVKIYWGPVDGGTNAAAWANVASAGSPAFSPFSITVSNLTPGTTLFYRCEATNALEQAWAPASASFQTLSDFTNVTLVSIGAIWRYHDAGIDLGSAWRNPAFDDSTWSQGLAPLGYGNGTEHTVVGGGQMPSTVYFRRTFQTSSNFLPISLTGFLQRDDGVVVYLNGSEIFRDNLPTGTISYNTPALASIGGTNESAILTFSIPTNLFLRGGNVLAAEVHQSADELALLPAASWTFNETNSPWNDSAGTNTFFAVGTNVAGWSGRINGCASNSASRNDFLQAADSPELSYTGPFTVGGWFAWGASSSEAICLQKAGEFKLSYTGTTINRYRFEVNGSVVQNQTAGTTNGQWRFVVAWYDGTNASIQMDNGTVYSTPASAPTNTANPLIALKKGDSNGGIAADEVFLYKRVLSSSERAALYGNQSLSTNSADLFFDLTLTGIMAQLPVITSQPANLARHAGESAGFSAAVSSPTPVTGQWLFNGTAIPNATNSLIFLENVTARDAGEYVFAASNLAGTVTSSPATLTVDTTPVFLTCGITNGSAFVFRVPGYGVPLSVLVSTNLADWIELFNLPATFTATNLVDYNTSNAPARFYRLRLNF